MKPWHAQIWNTLAHPKVLGITWKIKQGCTTTHDNMHRMGFKTVSMFVLCKHNVVTIDYILWRCSFRLKFWQWIAEFFAVDPSFSNYLQTINRCSRRSEYIRELWIASVLSTMVSIWRQGNTILII